MSRVIQNRKRKRGAATVEFAVCVPIIVLIFLGSVEAANMMFLKQALVQGAYEGAKAAIDQDSTNADVTAAVEAVGAGRRLNNLQISTDPVNVAAASPGQFIEVTVSAPGGANSFLSVNPFSQTTVSATAVMAKE